MLGWEEAEELDKLDDAEEDLDDVEEDLDDAEKDLDEDIHD